MRTWMILASLAVATTARAQPQPEPDPGLETTSYRNTTMLVDALSIGAIGLAFASEGPGGRDSRVTGPLFIAGAIGGVWIVPIIHGMRGHSDRAVGSWLLRQGAMGAGMLIGMATATCTPDEFLCGVDRLGPGLLAGLVVASILDAALLTDETTVKPSGTWTPIVAPRQGGATMGISGSF